MKMENKTRKMVMRRVERVNGRRGDFIYGHGAYNHLYH